MVLSSIMAAAVGFGCVGMLSPTDYYAPTDIIVHEFYALDHVVVLLLATGVLLVICGDRFRRDDI